MLNYNKHRDEHNQSKKKTIIGGCILLFVVLFAVIAFFKSSVVIKPGYTGIQYSLNGGIQEETLGQGFRWHSPIVKVIQYPTSRQQCYLSADNTEGEESNQSFNIPTADGKTVNVDLEFAYYFDADRLATTYSEFKGKSPEQIESEFIRAKMKSWAGEVASNFSVIDVYGDKRGELNAEVLKHTKENFDKYGIIIDSVSFTRIEPDEQTKEAIQNKINKQQEVEAAKLDAEKAQIQAEQKKIEAQAQADSIMIEAESQAKANELINASLTDNLLKKMEMEARQKHGWVTIQGADTIVKEKE
jgi:regulator of protease activity HflC (stomatin/prohibitin superfamily)